MQILSQEQFSIFDSELKTFELRKQAIVALLLFCGLRNKELCQLNYGDVFTLGYVKNSIYVRASGNHSCTSRHVPVPANAMSIIKAYSEGEVAHGRLWCDADPLFVTKNKKIRIQPKDVYRFVQQMTQVKLGQTFYPHALRHTYASRLLAYTNIRVVQQLLGHKSLNSTQIYTHPNSSECSAAVNRAFST